MEDPETAADGSYQLGNNSAAGKAATSDTLPSSAEVTASGAGGDGSHTFQNEATDSDPSSIPWYRFENKTRAQGYNTLGLGRGALVMSNIFLASALIFLAAEEAGCLTDSGDDVDDDCEEKIYGFKPASLVSNIAVISGVLSALFMPLFGAMVDYTPHRKLLGVVVAAAMIGIQAVQIGTMSKTWFVMAILQAVAGLLYQFEVLAVYAYLPEMSRDVGEQVMTRFTSVFTMCQFSSQVSFLFVIIVVSFALGLDDVQTAQVSQGINTVWSLTAFWIGWRLMPAAPANAVLPANYSNLLTAGFQKNVQTAKLIHQKYSAGLQWYLLALVFAEAGINSFTTLSVIYLDEHVGLTGAEIGVFFLITLLCTIPGAKMGGVITARSNPKRSYRWSLICVFLVTAGGAFMVDAAAQAVTYVWACVIGVNLGWYYPTENLFFSMIVPKGQEAELAGFFVYCTQILGWLPPLVFTVIVENDVSQTYGVFALTIFFLFAIALVSMAAPWEQIVANSHAPPDGDNNGQEADDPKEAAVLGPSTVRILSSNR